MAVTPHQIELIRRTHAHGARDRQIAAAASVSLSTVKRVRKALGLRSNCPANQRGYLGEQMVANAAQDRGYSVEWRKTNNAKCDLFINGLRVDVKAAAPSPGGGWRFRLPAVRSSFFGQYAYAKDYAKDTDLLVLVALNSSSTDADFYILPSHSLPRHVQVRPGSRSDAHLDAWHLFPASVFPLSA